MTSDEAVCKARRGVLQAIADNVNDIIAAHGGTARAVVQTLESESLDAYAAAVYARAIGDAIRCVEGVPKVPVMMTMLTENGAQSFHTTAATAPALDAALTRLRAMEGT